MDDHAESDELQVVAAACRSGMLLLTHGGAGHRTAATYDELAAEVADLRAALERRAVIEQATGILMARTWCNAEHALERLVQQARYEDRDVRDVAAELVSRNVRA
jgi:AmiR/NasT family two-component response regulator